MQKQKFTEAEVREQFFCYATGTANGAPERFWEWHIDSHAGSVIPKNRRHCISKLFEKFTTEQVLEEVHKHFEKS